MYVSKILIYTILVGHTSFVTNLCKDQGTSLELSFLIYEMKK